MQKDSIEYQVLSKLIFAERLSSLFEEVSAEQNIVSDVLKQLIREGMVATVANQESQIAKTEIYYDSDHMDTYAYIITAKGLRELEQKK
mgnify:CR=1 FL=1